ncbi:hypothetical protein BKA63DRAFT_568557 [Paraphoma chrysanthemicola]|nr:hypothetical protein BKA63DRAFT_568557 [Paraphoma chrysanthemicola]
MDMPFQQDPRLQQQQQRLATQQRLLQQQRQRAGMANTQFSPQAQMQLPQTFNGAAAAAAPQGQNVGNVGAWTQTQHYSQHHFQSYLAQSATPVPVPVTQARQMGNGAAPFAPQRQDNGVEVARMYPQQNAIVRPLSQSNTARPIAATQARQVGNGVAPVATPRQDGRNGGARDVAHEYMQNGVVRTPEQTDVTKFGPGAQDQQIFKGTAPVASSRQYGMDGRARVGSQQYAQNGVGRLSQPDTLRPVPASQSPQAFNSASPPRQNVGKEVPQISSQHYQNRPGPQNEVRPHPPQSSPRLSEKRKNAPTSPFHPPKRREIIDLTGTNSPASSRPTQQEPNHGFGLNTTIFPSSTPPSHPHSRPQTQPQKQKHNQVLDPQQTVVTPALIHLHAIHHGVDPSHLEFGSNIRRMINARLMHYAELSAAKSLLDPSPAVLPRLIAQRKREDYERTKRDADSTGRVCEFGYVPEQLTAMAKAKVQSGEFDWGWSQCDKERLGPVGVEMLESLGCVREEDAEGEREEGVWRPMEEVGISEERAGVLWGLEWIAKVLDGGEDDDEVE